MTGAVIGGGWVDRILFHTLLGVKFLGHMVSFSKLPNCFPKWLYHFLFLLAIHEASNFTIPSPTLGIVFLFDSIMTNDVDAVLCHIGHLCIFLVETSIHIICPFFKKIRALPFYLSCKSIFTYFEYKSFITEKIYKYFLPVYLVF